MKREWTEADISEIYNSPLIPLMQRSAEIHRNNWNTGEVQVCTLLSIKTGACTEDCGYCAQSARNNTGLEVERLMDTGKVLEAASNARLPDRPDSVWVLPGVKSKTMRILNRFLKWCAVSVP